MSSYANDLAVLKQMVEFERAYSELRDIMYCGPSMRVASAKAQALRNIYSAAMALAAICGSAAIADPRARVMSSELASEEFWKWIIRQPMLDPDDEFRKKFVDAITDVCGDGAHTAQGFAEVLRSKESLVPMYLELLLEYHTDIKP